MINYPTNRGQFLDINSRFIKNLFNLNKNNKNQVTTSYHYVRIYSYIIRSRNFTHNFGLMRYGIFGENIVKIPYYNLLF